MKKERHTTTVTTTRVDVRKALEQGGARALTDEEERVLRMRAGVGLLPEQKLELRGQSSPETRAKLAMIEKLALDAMGQKDEPARASRSLSAKDHIIARLRTESKRDQ